VETPSTVCKKTKPQVSLIQWNHIFRKMQKNIASAYVIGMKLEFYIQLHMPMGMHTWLDYILPPVPK
jgi:hypothetical protein